MLVLLKGNTPELHAEVVRARYQRLGCSAAFTDAKVADVLAHTEASAHPLGYAWLKPGEEPHMVRSVDPATQRKSHAFV